MLYNLLLYDLMEKVMGAEYPCLSAYLFKTTLAVSYYAYVLISYLFKTPSTVSYYAYVPLLICSLCYRQFHEKYVYYLILRCFPLSDSSSSLIRISSCYNAVFRQTNCFLLKYIVSRVSNDFWNCFLYSRQRFKLLRKL